jgi:ABC-type sugar transport system ATPase subunit
MRKEIFRAREINYSFEGHLILDNFNIHLLKSEVLGVFGFSEGGKAAIFDLIEGKIRPDSGYIFYNGIPDNPETNYRKTARIDTNSLLVESLTMWENFFIINNKKKFLLNPQSLLRKNTPGFLKNYGLNFDLKTKAGDLNAIERLKSEILKACLLGAEIILIDDLLPNFTDSEYIVIDKFISLLTKKGIAFIINTCYLNPLIKCTDRISFLYQGKIIKSFDNKTDNHDRMNNLIYSLCEFKTQKRRENIAPSDSHFTIGIRILGDKFINIEMEPNKITAIIDFTKNIFSLYNTALNRFHRFLVFNGDYIGDAYRIISGKKYCFFDLSLNNRIVESFSPVDNLCMGLFYKFSLFGFIRRSRIRYITKAFSEWYGDDELMNRDNCYNISKKEIVSILLFRLKIINPNILVCILPNLDTDYEINRMILQELTFLAESGASICVILLNSETPYNFADKYIALFEGNLENDIFTYDIYTKS